MKNHRQSRLQQLELKFKAILDKQNQENHSGTQSYKNLHRQRSPMREALSSLQSDTIIKSSPYQSNSKLKLQLQSQADKLIKERSLLGIQSSDSKQRLSKNYQMSIVPSTRTSTQDILQFSSGQYSPQLSVRRALSPTPFIQSESKKDLEKEFFNGKIQQITLEDMLSESKLIELNILIGSMRTEQFQVLPSLYVDKLIRLAHTILKKVPQ